MDLPDWMDGAQAVVHHHTPSGEALVLTAAGMIGLTGVNSDGVGVCVNTLAMLHHSADGLPVAFAMRGALERSSAADAATFLRGVPHASGQHYAVVGRDGAVGLECSAAGTVESASGERFCHTNHPVRSEDIDPTVDRPTGTADSRTRQKRLERSAAGITSPVECRQLLSDRDAPLSVHASADRPWLTFGSVVYELGEPVRAWVAAGPPDHTPYSEHQL
jgi:hypothetical protein